MSRLILWLAIAVSLLAPQSVHSQMVRLLPGGGVNVRAPFVRVYVDGNGNTRVRAPFVDIHAPGRGVPPGNYFPGQVIPNNGRFPNQRTNPNGTQSGSGFEVAPGELGSRTPANNGSRGSAGNSSSRNRPQPANSNRFPTRGDSNSGAFRSSGSIGEETVSVLIGSGETGPSLVAMRWRELRRQTRHAALQMEQQLGRFDSAAAYKKILKAGTIQDILAEDVETPPDAKSILELKSIRANYVRLASDTSHAQIAKSNEFGLLKKSLDEITKAPIERQRQWLATSWNAMAEDLNRFRTAADWKEFLQLPDIIHATQQPNPESLNAAMQPLQKIHQRFEKSNTNPAYRLVTELKSFQTTRIDLAAYVRMLQKQKNDPAEELPRPKGKNPPID